MLTIILGGMSTVYATSGGLDGPGSGDTGGDTQGDDIPLWNWRQLGMRFYLVDSNGNRVSRVVDVTKTSERLATPDKNGNIVGEMYTSARREALGTDKSSYARVDHNLVSNTLPGMIFSMDNDNGNGEAFKQWFLSKASDGDSIAANWLEYGSGGNMLFAPYSGVLTNPETGKPSILYTMLENDLALIVEPVTWHRPASYPGTNIYHTLVYGSMYNLMQWHAQHNWEYAQFKSSTNILGGHMFTPYHHAIKGFIVGGQATSNYIFEWPSDADNPSKKQIPDALSAIQGSNTGYAIHYYTPQELTDETGTYKNKIFDLEVEIEATEAETTALTLGTLMSGTYPVLKTDLPIKYNIPEPEPNGYNMPDKAPERGYKNPKGEYKFTVLVKTNDPEQTLKKFTDGDTLYNALQSGSLGYTQKPQSINIRNEVRQDPLYKFFYVNIWVSFKEPQLGNITIPTPPPATPGDGYIRKDEITAAQKTTVPGGSVSIVPKATPPSCSWSGTGHGKGASYVSWSSFKANFTSAATKEHKVLHSSQAESDKYTIVGTPSSAYRMKYKPGTSTEELTKQKSNSNGGSLSFKLPTNTQVDFIAHRSGGNTGLKTPPLAAYMKDSSYNQTYTQYMTASGITHQAVYCPEEVTDSKYGYMESSTYYDIKFKAYGEVTERTSEARYNAYYPCGYNTTHSYQDPINCPTPPCTHSGGHGYKTKYYTEWHGREHYINNLTSHSTSVANGGAESNFRVSVEGTYNGKPITVSAVAKDFKVYKNSGQNVSDGGILVKTPVVQEFYPTYIMRADYIEHDYEGNQSPDARAKVWMLSKQKRTLYTYNVHTVELSGLTEPGVQAPWSTDKQDKDNETATNKPTVKAGLVVKPTQVTAEYTIKSTVWLQDTRFVAARNKGLAESRNAAALKEHSDLVNQFLGMGQNKRDDGYYAFGYSSIPGAYDLDMVGRGVTELKNNFENVVNGTRKYYSDSQVGDTLDQTQLTTAKAVSSRSTLAATGFYTNKLEGSNDANIDRSFTINLPASGLAAATSKTITLSSKNVGASSGSGEHAACITDGLTKIDTLLESGSGNNSWYREDYEGMVCVTLTTKVTIQLEGGYSVLWRALSDWRDLTPIQPYTTAKPQASSRQQEIQPIIKAGEAGIGYGIMTDNLQVGNYDFGRVSLLWKPYLFHIRASAYDDVVR